MSGRQWVRYLKSPDDDDWLDWWMIDWYKIRGTNLAELLIEIPECIGHCDLSLMNGEGWANLLSECPELKDQCKDWWKLDGKDWAMLLKKCPDEGFEEHCDWFKLDEDDWNMLLRKRPQFADKCIEMGFDVPKRDDANDEDDEGDVFDKCHKYYDEDSDQIFISIPNDLG